MSTLEYDPDLLTDLQDVVDNPILWSSTMLGPLQEGQENFSPNYVQRLIMDPANKDRVAIRCHRRAGKSVALAALALHCACTKYDAQVRLFCPVGSQVQEVFSQIRNFINVTPWLKNVVKKDSSSLPQEIAISQPGGRTASIKGYTTGAKSKSGALSSRGTQADLVLVDEAAYLTEEDWLALSAIMMGDIYRARNKARPRIYIASTPTHHRGQYWSMFNTPEGRELYTQVHMPLTSNPDALSIPGYVEGIKASCFCNQLAWEQEWMAEFPSQGAGIFPPHLINTAKRNFSYTEYLQTVISSNVKPVCTIGVDWNKSDTKGHGPNILVLVLLPQGRYRVAYREEIPRHNFRLTKAVERIIELNEIFEPKAIFVDRGYGEQSTEMLLLHGRRFPHTRLADIVEAIDFGGLIKIPMPAGEPDARRFKPAAVNMLRKWFEDGIIEISSADLMLENELAQYSIISASDSSVKFSDENDHAIAALMLAAMASWQKVYNPTIPPVSTQPLFIPQREIASNTHQISAPGTLTWISRDDSGLRSSIGGIGGRSRLGSVGGYGGRSRI